MNFHVVAKYLGLLMVAFATSMLPSAFWSIYYRDAGLAPIVGAMIVTSALGGGLYLWGRRRPDEEIFRKEATAIVGLAWMASAACGALPFFFARLEEMPTFTDCFFEAMSGLTTTGASVLSNIEALPRSILFWRSWTHWLGGLGIIMLFVAVLPYLGGGGRAMVRSEVTGPVKDGLTPRIKDTAQLLWRLYIGYTIVETAALMMAGMSFFDALCHTFGTLATGGFSTKNDSLAFYQSTVSVDLIVIVFMALAGSNFALMHKFLSGKNWRLWRDTEWRIYALTIAISTVFVTTVLFRANIYSDVAQALRDSLFTVVSMLTTTGYVTADFESWPAAAQCLLVFLMFVGGCAGSTGGGMKVMRWIILAKIARLNVEKIYRPRRIRKIKMGGAVLDDDLQQSILGLSLLWMLLLVGGTMGIATLERGGIDLVTAFSSVVSSLNNIGPGFSMVGATENYAFFTLPSKWLLSLLMLLGRLEIYSILVLFVPQFWRMK